MIKSRIREVDLTDSAAGLDARIQAAKDALSDASWRMEAERNLGPINRPGLSDNFEYTARLERDLVRLLQLKRSRK